jgi:hypothetical protein
VVADGETHEQAVFIAKEVMKLIDLNFRTDADLAIVKSAMERWSKLLDTNGESLPTQFRLLSQKIDRESEWQRKQNEQKSAIKVALISIIPGVLGILGGLAGAALSQWFALVK